MECEADGCAKECNPRGGGLLCTTHYGRRKRWRNGMLARLADLHSGGVLEEKELLDLRERVYERKWV